MYNIASENQRTGSYLRFGGMASNSPENLLRKSFGEFLLTSGEFPLLSIFENSCSPRSPLHKDNTLVKSGEGEFR